MKKLIEIAITAIIALFVAYLPFLRSQNAEIPDKRNIKTGWIIPTETYADQSYIVKTNDGAWLCCITTGVGHEGETGQHVVTMRSMDQGKTWEKPVDVEPADGPEASYAVMLKIPDGRIYIFYNHNTDNVREVKADDPPFKGGWCKRVDCQGYFVFKYSDDHGRSWSQQRTAVPVREFEIDRKNPYGGTIRYFWNVGKSFTFGGAGYVPLHKVGGLGDGLYKSSEGALLKSNNILSERNPEKIRWETLPDGDFGLRTPAGGGPVAEEQSISVLSDGSFYCVYRTIDGHPVFTYSRDGGRTWDVPQYKRYANNRLIKHPRAANFAWRCENGKFLYWFHNHGGSFILNHPDRRGMAYNDRNPVWLCGGIEVDSPKGKVIKWSQPEIVLYDDDPFIRMSYPDLVEHDGRYFLTETQKNIARTHQINPVLLEGLWNQFNNKDVASKGIILEIPGKDSVIPREIAMPELPAFLIRNNRQADYGTGDLHAGFSIDLWIQFKSLTENQMILDNRTNNGQGFVLRTTNNSAIEIIMNDGRTESRWNSDPGLLQTGKLHHVAVIIDGGPKIITFVVDGILCDGGEFRQFGWGRFNPNFRGAGGDKVLRIGQNLNGEIKKVRIYNRYLRTSEAIGNFQAGIN